MTLRLEMHTTGAPLDRVRLARRLAALFSREEARGAPADSRGSCGEPRSECTVEESETCSPSDSLPTS